MAILARTFNSLIADGAFAAGLAVLAVGAFVVAAKQQTPQPLQMSA